MSILFSSKKIGALDIGHRFVHSATYGQMAGSSGEVTPELIKRYLILARGGIGLIIPGFLGVHPLGKAVPRQTGIQVKKINEGAESLSYVSCAKCLAAVFIGKPLRCYNS